MYNVPEQLIATNKEALESFISFAGILFVGTEKMIDLNLKTAKAAFADSAKTVKALSGIKDVQELTDIQSTFVQPAADKFAAYGRGVYGVATETQADLTKFFEERIGDTEQELRDRAGQGREERPRRFRCGRSRCEVRSRRRQPGLRRVLEGQPPGRGSDRSDRDRSDQHQRRQEKGRVSQHPSRQKAPGEIRGPFCFGNPAAGRCPIKSAPVPVTPLPSSHAPYRPSDLESPRQACARFTRCTHPRPVRRGP